MSRILHRIWMGPPQPERFVENGRRWAELNPELEVRQWGEEVMPAPELMQHAPAHDRWRWASDIARLQLLFEHGGMYVDADVKPLRSVWALMDLLLLSRDAIVAWSPNRGPGGGKVLSNAVILARPGSDYIAACLEELPGRIGRMLGERTARVTGPYLLDYVMRQREWPKLTVFESWAFYPRGQRGRRNRDNPPLGWKPWTEHEWANTRGK